MWFRALQVCLVCLLSLTEADDVSKDVEAIVQRLSQLEQKHVHQQEVVQSQGQLIQQLQGQLEYERLRNDAMYHQMTSLRRMCENGRTRAWHAQQQTTVNVASTDKSVNLTTLHRHASKPSKNNVMSAKKRLLLDESGNGGGVAFTAYLDADHEYGSGQTVKFNQAITNEGDGYSIHTGAFTCPIPGVYLFTFVIGQRSEGDDLNGVYAQLKVNSVNVVDAAVDSYHSAQDLQGGNSAVVRLEKGDTVFVTVNANHVEGSSSNRFTTFTGAYLFA